MGIDTNVMRFLLAVRNVQISFLHTVTIGRHEMFVSESQVKRVLKDFDLAIDPARVHLAGANQFSEPFFRYLGAEEIVSIDASDFEGANVVHDMNLPIPGELKERFDVVFDGGTLEHVFNFPTAVANCMQMVRLGGYFIGCAPANNFCGHGFYQFSPELYFRIFSAENGFRIRQLLLVEKLDNSEWFEIRDPALRGSRIQIANEVPLYMMVAAEREALVPLFHDPPQQSDYVSAWQSSSDVGVVQPLGEPGHRQLGIRRKLLSVGGSVGWLNPFRRIEAAA